MAIVPTTLFCDSPPEGAVSTAIHNDAQFGMAVLGGTAALLLRVVLWPASDAVSEGPAMHRQVFCDFPTGTILVWHRNDSRKDGVCGPFVRLFDSFGIVGDHPTPTSPQPDHKSRGRLANYHLIRRSLKSALHLRRQLALRSSTFRGGE